MQSASISPNKKNFRLVLQDEFVSRCRKNPRYSLRAFAKSLGIEASPLSAILRGKRPLTIKTQRKLALAMGFSLDDAENFIAVKNNKPAQFQQITLDSYAVISDWYHYAILELTRIKGFKAEPQYVSRCLGITATEAHVAMERLQRLGLLVKKPNGRWIDATTDGLATNINGSLTSGASKKLQRQILEMSLAALDCLPTEIRSHTSMTMAISPEDLPEAREKIKQFRRSLCEFFEKTNQPTQVYQLAISLFPITKMEN